MTTLIRTNGSKEIIAAPTMDEAKLIVGGPLSVICLDNEKIIICNEKAVYQELPQNITAGKILSIIKNKPLAVLGDIILTDSSFLHFNNF